MSESRPDTPPRVLVSLSDDAFRERIVSALGDCEVRAGDGSTPIGDDVDVAVLRRADLGDDPVGNLAGTTDRATVVVLSAEDDPHDRAQLLAAGVAHVLDAATPIARLASTIEAIAEAERGGRVTGPEVRGNHAEPSLVDFLSRSAAMRRFVELAARVADADATLLITGETGVGKERLARAVHGESPRSERPFVCVNCGALPAPLLESQLFGHEEGAFTGASEMHRGFFEQADSGTIFLDEIGELPIELQVKLLTVLQRHEVQRLGAEAPVAIDVRVMAATNRDLRELVAEGSFREDLFYRLNVVALEVPPLRERPEDIADLAGQLVAHFRAETEGSTIERIDTDALDRLVAYAWPGNVRELINVIERATVLGRGDAIRVVDLPPEVVEGTNATGAPAPTPNATGRTLKEVRDAAIAQAERAYLHDALTHTSGSIKETAALAGISTRALYDRLRRYDLRKEDYRA